MKYQVHRRVGEKGDFLHVGDAVNPVLDDFNLSPGEVYFYTITARDINGIASERSEMRYIRLAPPELGALLPPSWASYQIRPEGIALAWLHENPEHVLAFNLYRRKEGDSSFTLLSSTLDSTFLDRDVFLGNRYEYVVSALDRKLQESDNSDVLKILNVSSAVLAPADSRLLAIKTLEEVTARTELVTQFNQDGYGFVSPVDIEYLPSEQKLFVSDSGTGLITVIGPNGDILARHGGRGAQPWEFERLLGIAVDEHGYVFAADAYRGEIVVFSPRGNFDRRIQLKEMVLEYFGPGFQLRFPWFRFGLVDIIAGSDDRLFVVDNPNGWVYVLDNKDELVKVIGERGSDPGRMHYPTFANRDPGGRLVVSDTLNSRLQMFDLNGGYLGAIGERGLGIGQFLRPKGIAISRDGHIYVADSQQNVIQVFDDEGEFVFLLTNERGLPIDLGSPNGLVFVEPDLLIVCEKLARRVQIRKILFATAGGGDRIDVVPLKKP
ncbi:MAG: 6-bladed beta-propeller [bacterium]|nr:6-bladed beta-propeller [bacterium]